MLALELAVHRRPVGLDRAPMPVPTAVTGLGEQPRFQDRVGQIVRQRPGQARSLKPSDHQPHRRGHRAHPSRNLPARQPGRLHPDHIAHTAHRKPLRQHPGSPFAKPKGLTLWEPEEASSPGRLQIGMVGEIISECWATSSGIRSYAARFLETSPRVSPGRPASPPPRLDYESRVACLGISCDSIRSQHDRMDAT